MGIEEVSELACQTQVFRRIRPWRLQGAPNTWGVMPSSQVPALSGLPCPSAGRTDQNDRKTLRRPGPGPPWCALGLRLCLGFFLRQASGLPWMISKGPLPPLFCEYESAFQTGSFCVGFRNPGNQAVILTLAFLEREQATAHPIHVCTWQPRHAPKG